LNRIKKRKRKTQVGAHGIRADRFKVSSVRDGIVEVEGGIRGVTET